ncbi:hypothetical protein TrRE_jg12227, partial [Triparma retinervis]
MCSGLVSIAGFHQRHTKAKERKKIVDPRKEDSEAFKGWKEKKDEEMRKTRKAALAAGEDKLGGASKVAPKDNASDNAKATEEEHRAWIKSKNLALKKKSRDRKKKEADMWDAMKREREELIERKRKELKPHVERRKLLFKMEHEKYKSMTSGAGLPSKLAARLKELKRNPLNGSVVMMKDNQDDEEEELNVYGEDFEQPSVEKSSTGAGYEDDFDDNDANSEYGDDFSAPPQASPQKAADTTPQLFKTVTKEATPSRIRARTFALGLNGQDNAQTNKSIEASEALGPSGGSTNMAKINKSSKITLLALKEKLNHSAQILSLTAGAQYRHRKTIQRANETFGTVRSLRHKLSLDEKALEESERKRLEQWIKDHPPKHGVENRPVWDNDFTNPESSDLNARDTKKAVEEARSKSFRGTVGPGYGVDLNAVPEGFGMGTNVDGFTLNGVEKALDEPDLLELGSFFSPPVAVQAVVGAVAVLLGIEPDWQGVYKGLLRNSYYFLTCLRFFDKDAVSLHTALVLEQYMDSVLFEEDKCMRGSRALGKLRAWVVAVWDYITGEELRRMQEGPPTMVSAGGSPKQETEGPRTPTMTTMGPPQPRAPPSTPMTPDVRKKDVIKVDPTVAPGNFDETDYSESSEEDNDGDYADDFTEDNTRSTAIDAAKLMGELEELKRQLADAKLANQHAEERVKTAEDTAARALEKEEAEVKAAREEMQEKEIHDIEVVKEEMQRSASEALARAKEDARLEIDRANAAATSANKAVAELKAAAKEKSRMAMELSAMLAKEKLMRKLATKKKAEPVLKGILDFAADEEEETKMPTPVLEGILDAKVEEERKMIEERLKVLEEDQKRREEEGKEKDMVIELQNGILKAMKWLNARDEVIREGLNFGALSIHPGVEQLGVEQLEKLIGWFKKADLVNGSGPKAQEGVEGYEKAKKAAANLPKDNLAELADFDTRMQESNVQMDAAVKAFQSDLLDEVGRIWGRAKTLGVAEHYVPDQEGETLEQVRLSGGLEGVKGTVEGVKVATLSLLDGFIHLGDVMMKDAGGNGIGEYTEALRCGLIARCLDVKCADAMVKAGVGYEDVGETAKASELYILGIKAEGSKVVAEATYHLGVLKVEAGEDEEGEKLLDSAAALAAREGNAHLLTECHREKGRHLGSKGRWKEAAKSYGIASELNKELPEYLSAWGFALKEA